MTTGPAGGPVDADLLVVGAGPTGTVLAGLAAGRGLRVVVVERDGEVFPLPRAVQCDHQVLRIFQELGCADEVVADAVANPGLDLLRADREVLASFTVPPTGTSGWPSSILFHQPTLERTLRRAAASLGVELRTGVEAISLEQDHDGVTAQLSAGTLRARYAVGCDGAESLTRGVIGGARVDAGFEEAWLVVDLLLTGRPAGLPTRSLQVCDPRRPHTVVPMPAPRFRLEFLLLPGETEDQIQEPATVAELIGRWIEPGFADVERSAVYRFHGWAASRWRHRRLLVAGEAAHQSPPFLGQGMCTGLRDAANLTWKLAMVVDGQATDRLLDTYQGEREPHARYINQAAVEFGKLICMTDPGQAAARDAALLASRSGTGEVPELLPPLRRGPAIGPDGGDLFPQPELDGRRFDDVVGRGFALITAAPLDRASANAAWWSERGVLLDAESAPELAALLDGRAACAVRPDRYVLARGEVDEVTRATRDALTGGRPGGGRSRPSEGGRPQDSRD